MLYGVFTMPLKFITLKALCSGLLVSLILTTFLCLQSNLIAFHYEIRVFLQLLLDFREWIRYDHDDQNLRAQVAVESLLDPGVIGCHVVGQTGTNRCYVVFLLMFDQKICAISREA